MAVGRQRSYVLGRNGQVADVVVEDSSGAGGISRAHAVLINSSGATFLQDLDSAHGTWLDDDGRLESVPQLGRRLSSDELVKLREGQTFRLGTSRNVFRVVGAEPISVGRWNPPGWSEAPSRSEGHAIEIRFENSNPYLQHLVEEGDNVDEMLPLTERFTLVGRGAQLCDLVVRHESISRQHAAFLHAEQDTFVQDLGSTSGTFIDGLRLPPNQPTKLTDGQVLRFGECKTTYTYRKLKSQGDEKKRKRASGSGALKIRK